MNTILNEKDFYNNRHSDFIKMDYLDYLRCIEGRSSLSDFAIITSKRIFSELDPYGEENWNDDPDYKGFMEHLMEYYDLGVPIGFDDLIDLAKKYNTEIPSYNKSGKLKFEII